MDRKKLLAAYHAAAKGIGLDEDGRRDMLEARTGNRSASDCSDAQLRQVLDHLNRRPGRGGGRASSGVATKARALWISLHALGLISDPSERALGAWVKRQYGVDDLRFVRGADSFAVIEGLKQWAGRGGVDWSRHVDPRRCVLAAQWQVLVKAGAAPALDLSAFASTITGLSSVAFADGEALDRVIQALGVLVRAARPA